MGQQHIARFGYRRHPDQDRVGANLAEHQVVIVGAGPVGLSLAIDLAQRGQVRAGPILIGMAAIAESGGVLLSHALAMLRIAVTIVSLATISVNPKTRNPDL